MVSHLEHLSLYDSFALILSFLSPCNQTAAVIFSSRKRRFKKFYVLYIS